MEARKVAWKLPFEGFEYYYNLTSTRTYSLTMDVDWASDDVLREVLNWFIENKLPITAFCTHDSAVAREFQEHPLVEIAIHPNFSKAADPALKVRQLKRFYPSAVGSRSHRNIIGRDFTDALAKEELIYDSSKLLWLANYCEAYPLYNGMVEIPYVWEDGVHVELNTSMDTEQLHLDSPGVKILNIHPVLFFLNHRSYQTLKEFTSQFSDLTSVPYEVYCKNVNHSFGIGDFSKALFTGLRDRGAQFYLLGDLAEKAYLHLHSERSNTSTHVH